jgi:hypothetical protein
MPQAGLTVTADPTVWLPVAMLSAAAAPPGGSPRRAALAVAGPRRYALAALPPAAAPTSAVTPFNSAAGSAAMAAGSPPPPSPAEVAAAAASAAAGGGPVARLAVWSAGAGAVICDCYEGLDPTRLSIEETIEPRIRMIFWDDAPTAGLSMSRSGGGPAAARPPALGRGVSGVPSEGADGAVVVRLTPVFKPAAATAAEPSAGAGSAAGYFCETGSQQRAPHAGEQPPALTAAPQTDSTGELAHGGDNIAVPQAEAADGSERSASKAAAGLEEFFASPANGRGGGSAGELEPFMCLPACQGPSPLGQLQPEVHPVNTGLPRPMGCEGASSGQLCGGGEPGPEDFFSLFSRHQCVQLQQQRRANSRVASPQQQKVMQAPSLPPCAVDGVRSTAPVPLGSELPPWSAELPRSRGGSPSPARPASSCSANGRAGGGGVHAIRGSYLEGYLEGQRKEAAAAAAELTQIERSDGSLRRAWWELPPPPPPAQAAAAWQTDGHAGSKGCVSGRPRGALSSPAPAGPLAEAVEALQQQRQHQQEEEEEEVEEEEEERQQNAAPSASSAPRLVRRTVSFDNARQLLRSLRLVLGGGDRARRHGGSISSTDQAAGICGVDQRSAALALPSPESVSTQGDLGTSASDGGGSGSGSGSHSARGRSSSGAAAAIDIRYFLGAYSPTSSLGGGAFSPKAAGPTVPPSANDRASGQRLQQEGDGVSGADSIAANMSTTAIDRTRAGPAEGCGGSQQVELSFGALCSAHGQEQSAGWQTPVSPGASRRGLSRLSSSRKAQADEGEGLGLHTAPPSLQHAEGDADVQQLPMKLLPPAKQLDSAPQLPPPQLQQTGAFPLAGGERRPLFTLALFNRLQRSKSERAPSALASGDRLDDSCLGSSSSPKGWSSSSMPGLPWGGSKCISGVGTGGAFLQLPAEAAGCSEGGGAAGGSIAAFLRRNASSSAMGSSLACSTASGSAQQTLASAVPFEQAVGQQAPQPEVPRPSCPIPAGQPDASSVKVPAGVLASAQAPLAAVTPLTTCSRVLARLRAAAVPAPQPGGRAAAANTHAAAAGGSQGPPNNWQQSPQQQTHSWSPSSLPGRQAEWQHWAQPLLASSAGDQGEGVAAIARSIDSLAASFQHYLRAAHPTATTPSSCGCSVSAAAAGQTFGTVASPATAVHQMPDSAPLLLEASVTAALAVPAASPASVAAPAAVAAAPEAATQTMESRAGLGGTRCAREGGHAKRRLFPPAGAEGCSHLAAEEQHPCQYLQQASLESGSSSRLFCSGHGSLDDSSTASRDQRWTRHAELDPGSSGGWELGAPDEGQQAQPPVRCLGVDKEWCKVLNRCALPAGE